MVTTSYVAPDMEALHDQAMSKGLTILNECGLDPGMSALSPVLLLLG
jgi:alpha-aminoadipic semialdehyde synthase